MVAIDEAEAGAKAEEVLADWRARDPDLYHLSIDHIEEHSRAWIVTFSTGRYRTGDVSSALAGTSPFVIEKANGELHRYGSGPDEYEKFLAWLDAAR